MYDLISIFGVLDQMLSEGLPLLHGRCRDETAQPCYVLPLQIAAVQRIMTQYALLMARLMEIHALLTAPNRL